MKHGRKAKKRVEKQYAKMAAEGLPNDLGGSEPAHRLRRMGYSDQDIASVPESSLVGLGCGNPTALAGLKEGETVLDIGAGAGLDALSYRMQTSVQSNPGAGDLERLTE